MYAVRSLIVFILVFSENYVQKTFAATEDPPPCEPDSEGQYGCQGLFECKPFVCCKLVVPKPDKGTCRLNYDGDPCKESNHCTSGFCDTSKGQCRGGYPPRLGDDCANEFSCDPKAHMVCTNRKCSCPEELEWDRDVTACVVKGTKKTKKTINATCTEDDECIKERLLKCYNGTCDCGLGFSWIEAICKPNAQQLTCDPSVFPNECPHDSKQMECDKDQRVCRCRQDMEYSPSMKACKLKAEENCLINNTLEHDQCLSQQCLNETGSANHTCACKDNNGIPEIWSSDPPGCVTDYFEFTCSGSESECRPAKFNTSRQGLICKDSSCKCAKGLAYKRGYCVEANRLFDDPCDPDGVRPTCNTDLDLTCRDVGGGDFRCVCLQRVMTVRGKRHTVLLTWNGAQKKCDLKSHGERCKEAIECRSGVCQVTCVGEQPLRSRLSTGATIYEYHTKVYHNYVFLIISFSMIVTLF